VATINILHDIALAESRLAPNGSLDERDKSEDSFETSKLNIALKTQSSTDVSTDSGSEHQEDFLPSSALEGRRLAIFQSVAQSEESSAYKGKEDG